MCVTLVAFIFKPRHACWNGWIKRDGCLDLSDSCWLCSLSSVKRQARAWQQGCDVRREEGGLRSLDPGVTQRQIYYKVTQSKKMSTADQIICKYQENIRLQFVLLDAEAGAGPTLQAGRGPGPSCVATFSPGPHRAGIRIKLQTRKRASSLGRGNLISGRVNTQIRQGWEWTSGQAPSVPPPVIRERVAPGDWHFVQRKDQKSFVLWQFMDVRAVVMMMVRRTNFLASSLFSAKPLPSQGVIISLKSPSEGWSAEDDSDQELQWAQRDHQLGPLSLLLWQ